MPPSNSLLDRPVRTRAPRLIAALVAIACVGCGPFGYLKKVATDATRAVAEAEAAGAEEYAPYEYWGAVAYLEQSKVLMGYSEYERSFDFGQRATQLANEAKVKAQRVKQGGSTVRDEDIAAPDQLKEGQDAGEGDAGEGDAAEGDEAAASESDKAEASEGDKAEDKDEGDLP